jgi:hypothetical protein
LAREVGLQGRRRTERSHPVENRNKEKNKARNDCQRIRLVLACCKLRNAAGFFLK